MAAARRRPRHPPRTKDNPEALNRLRETRQSPPGRITTSYKALDPMFYRVGFFMAPYCPRRRLDRCASWFGSGGVAGPRAGGRQLNFIVCRSCRVDYSDQTTFYNEFLYVLTTRSEGVRRRTQGRGRKRTWELAAGELRGELFLFCTLPRPMTAPECTVVPRLCGDPGGMCGNSWPALVRAFRHRFDKLR